MLPGKTRENVFYGVFTDSTVIQERENSVRFFKRQHLLFPFQNTYTKITSYWDIKKEVCGKHHEKSVVFESS